MLAMAGGQPPHYDAGLGHPSTPTTLFRVPNQPYIPRSLSLQSTSIFPLHPLTPLAPRPQLNVVVASSPPCLSSSSASSGLRSRYASVPSSPSTITFLASCPRCLRLLPHTMTHPPRRASSPSAFLLLFLRLATSFVLFEIVFLTARPRFARSQRAMSTSSPSAWVSPLLPLPIPSS